MLGIMAQTRALGPSAWPSEVAPEPAFEIPAEQKFLASFISGLSKELAADGLLVACHFDCEPPILLYSDGECDTDIDVEKSLLSCAVRSFDHSLLTTEPVSVASDHAGGMIFSAKLLLKNLAITMTSLFRDERAEASGACRARLAGLLPLAWPFFSMWSQGKEVAHRMSGLEAALEMSGGRTLLLDRGGRLLFANRSGMEFLASGRGLALNRDRLTASSLAETLRLNAAIEHLCCPDRSDAATTPVLVIPRRHLRPLMITLAVTEAHAGDEDDRMIVARLFDPEQDPSEFIAPACRFYGLSPSETKLTRHIAEGRSLAGAAAEIGIREQTARSYLKQIFLKTETNRQAELVALMLRSAVRLAPRCRAQVF